MSDLESRRASIASRLRTAREMAGLSQGQVAKLLGLNRPTISEAEAGRRRIPAEELVEYARIYGVELEWLACVDTDKVDTRQDRIQLAAREFSKLKPPDLDRLIKILEALKARGDTTS